MLVKIVKGEERFAIMVYSGKDAVGGSYADYLCFDSFSTCFNVKEWDSNVIYIEAVELEIIAKPARSSGKEVETYAIVTPLKLQCECSPP